MWLQDYWQSLDQGEALTAMIHRNESHQGRFWDYMHEIFLKRTRQHWPIFVRAWFENCIESWDYEFLPHFKCLPWKKQNQKTSHWDNLLMWSKFLLWLDFSSGKVSNCFDLSFSSVVWSHSWLAGVNMWGQKKNLLSFCICYTYIVYYMTSGSCSSALSYFRDFLSLQNINCVF